ncbi:hypothetical protein T4A_11456 [Trichinella pseudospiralis]|uniref:Uncharacterized protein n=1 Tax=Trichinella pseudospiralis TaxID=6337 RepID=A0A0V1EMK7_TRIPS|nr:hypothetical protein T4A_11456 [Trichinella pseudospiralis]
MLAIVERTVFDLKLLAISLPCNGLSYFTSIKALEIYVILIHCFNTLHCNDEQMTNAYLTEALVCLTDAASSNDLVNVTSSNCIPAVEWVSKLLKQVENGETKKAPFWNVKLPSFGQTSLECKLLACTCYLLTELDPLQLLLIKQTQPSSPYAMSTILIISILKLLHVSYSSPSSVIMFCNYKCSAILLHLVGDALKTLLI